MKKLSLHTKFFLVVTGMSVQCLVSAFIGMAGMRAVESDIKNIVKSAGDEKAVQEAVEDADKTFVTTRNINLGVTLVGIVLGQFVGWLVLRQAKRALGQVIISLERNSHQVQDASQQVSESAEKLAQSATEQASSLQETAASTQQLTSMVQRNMESSQRSSEVSTRSQNSAETGKRVVGDMTRAIEEIDRSNQDIMNQVNESNRQVSEITRVIAEIGEKTKVINDIVFQTKLLSFNASVEAARAGEHGKGFAVVAEEVGNLAQMSGNAAKEISDMLESSIRKVEAIVTDTKTRVDRLVATGKEKVETGSRIVQECAEVLNEIVGNVSEVSRMSVDISSASQEQAQGVQEISRAMGQLDAVTQTNAGASEQAANAASALSSQAVSLKHAVSQLGLIVNGGDMNAISASSPAQSSPDRHSETARVAPRPSSALKLVHSESKSAAAAPRSTGSKTTAKASTTGDLAVPSENDPRFKDV